MQRATIAGFVTIAAMILTWNEAPLQVAQPAATASPDPEVEKHHGTSGRDPDSMGSGTKRMPGEEPTANPRHHAAPAARRSPRAPDARDPHATPQSGYGS
jgi:hypothetical protein